MFMTENAHISNRKARRDFEILETYEAGIELKGTEIKSIRERQASLNDSFGRVDKGEVYLYNFHVSPYEFGNINNTDPLRPKKLLLKKSQISNLYLQTKAKGTALVPLELYFKGGLAKIKLGLGRGKKLFDKREDIKKREVELEMKRAMRGKR